MVTLEILSRDLAHCSPDVAGCTGGARLLGYDPEHGRIPRCLYFESGDSSKEAAIIVGANPGISKKHGLNAIAGVANGDRSVLYENWIQLFEREILKHYCFFTQPRALLNALGFKGDVLWTEVYKCENAGSSADFHCRPAVVCSDKFLDEELRYMHEKYNANYTVFACGGNAYHFLRNEFWNNPKRKHLIPRLVGTYHPSGSWSRGKFNSMFQKTDDTKVRKWVRDKFELSTNEPIYLSP